MHYMAMRPSWASISAEIGGASNSMAFMEGSLSMLFYSHVLSTSKAFSGNTEAAPLTATMHKMSSPHLPQFAGCQQHVVQFDVPCHGLDTMWTLLDCTCNGLRHGACTVTIIHGLHLPQNYPHVPL